MYLIAILTIVPLSSMTPVIIMVALWLVSYCYAECCYANFHDAECRYSECCDTEKHVKVKTD